MQISLDVLTHLGEIVAIAGGAWRVIVSINRLTSVLHDYPPHRHAPGGIIVYPYDYEPAPTGKINGSTAA